MAIRSHILTLACAALIAGCAPALSSFEPATIAPKGKVRVTVGGDVWIPPDRWRRAVDAAKEVEVVAEQRKLGETEKRMLLEGAAALMLLNPPSLAPHVAVAYTPLDHLEIALRCDSGTAWRLAGRYQLLHQERVGFSLTAGLGVARYTFAFPVNDVLKLVTVEDVSRFQVDVPLTVGKSGSWYHWWVGPRVLWTTYDIGMTIDLPPVSNEVVLASFDGRARYYGGQVGFALGHQGLFIGFELTVVARNASAALAIRNGATTPYRVLDVIVYPSVGLMGMFR